MQLYGAVHTDGRMKHFFGSLIIAVLASFVFTAIGYAWLRYDIQKINDDVSALQATVEELQTTRPTVNNTIMPRVPGNGDDVREHDVYVTRSDDPTSFLDSTVLVFDQGSVPEAVLLNNGELRMYFPSFKNFSQAGDEKIMAAKSVDNGKTWQELGLITITNALVGVTAVDPSLVQLADGRLRMYFFGSTVVIGDPAKIGGEHNIYSAVSEDGLTFTMEDGVRYAQEQITDPDVIYLPAYGTWLMYVSAGPQTRIITSNDGLEWFDTEFSWTGGGVPGAYVDADNVVHLYGCGQGGIMTETSIDGIIFDGTPTTALTASDQSIICDPSPVLLDDGTVLMVYKKAPTPTNNPTL